ncbi:DEKNAAC105672 [Brettanomyces naardenensis]|uniref:DEKNAAC105672 n=1 Tax=Brettanomyces naardenensis TaxID=13370 RepID=A0A448YU05_BRENA|nr:DEKNAAC105672 [Brettanomyces naardenensis]
MSYDGSQVANIQGQQQLRQQQPQQQQPQQQQQQQSQVKLPPISFLSDSLAQRNNSNVSNGAALNASTSSPVFQPTNTASNFSSFPGSFPSFNSLGTKNSIHLPSISSLTSGMGGVRGVDQTNAISSNQSIPSEENASLPAQLSSYNYSRTANTPGLVRRSSNASITQKSSETVRDTPPTSAETGKSPSTGSNDQVQDQQQQQQAAHLTTDEDHHRRTHHFHHHHHHHVEDDLGEKIKEAQSQLKDGGHIHIVHEPHGDHHHHKVYVHNPTTAENRDKERREQTSQQPQQSLQAKATVQAGGNESTILQNESTILDNSLNQTTILDQSTLAAQLESQPFEKRRMTVTSRDVLDGVSKFPRKHLGSIMYDEYPTYHTLIRYLRNISSEDLNKLEEDKKQYSVVERERKEFGILQSKRLELLPDLISNYINCTIDILVPYEALFDNVNVYDKRVWGTDIYTDDSDIVAMLYHCGVLHSQDPTKKKAKRVSRRQQQQQQKDSKFDSATHEYQFTNYTGAITPGNPDNIHNIISGTTSEDEAADLIVTLLILPTLQEYKGCYRNNYNSRSWRHHDGCSVALFAVRWCQLGEGVYYGGVSNYGSFRKRLLNERLDIVQRVRKQKDPVPVKNHNSSGSATVSANGKETIGHWVADKSFWKKNNNSNV